MKVEDILLDENGLQKAYGYEMNLGNRNLVIIKAKNGYIACGYIDKNMAEKLQDNAAFVSGVSTVDDMLSSQIVDLTSFAEKCGLIKRSNCQRRVKEFGLIFLVYLV